MLSQTCLNNGKILVCLNFRQSYILSHLSTMKFDLILPQVYTTEHNLQIVVCLTAFIYFVTKSVNRCRKLNEVGTSLDLGSSCQTR